MPRNKTVIFDELEPGRWYRLRSRRTKQDVLRFVVDRTPDRVVWNGPTGADQGVTGVSRRSFSVAYRTCDPVNETEVLPELDGFFGEVL